MPSSSRPPGARPRPAGTATTHDLADRLHSSAIHLLRRLRREDDALGLPAPQLSALSVIVFAGPVTLGALASAEQVRPPTITRLVDKLEAAGLVDRVPDPVDRRISRVEATAKGVKLLYDGRRRRVASLAASLRDLPAKERSALSKAVPILEKVVRAG
jgi:DNA-binding MarR family transcriptional regulator